MTYDDTHAMPVQLAGLDATVYDMGVMVDESGKPMRYLYSTSLRGEPYPVGCKHWRRLVVHVDDVDAPGIAERLLDVMSCRRQPHGCHAGLRSGSAHRGARAAARAS